MVKKSYWPIYVIGIAVIAAAFFVFKHFEPKNIVTGAPAYLPPAPASTSTPATNSTSSAPSPITSSLSNSAYFGVSAKLGFGNYLTDKNGQSLYIFDQDPPDQSVCVGSCATVWPAYGPSGTVPQNLPAGISVITRSDGSAQFIWNGHPLYHYYLDAKPGDTLGDNIGGVWHLVKI